MKRELDLSQGLGKYNPVGYRDVTVEHTRFPCVVSHGSIPPWLLGNYYKQSGAAFEVKSPKEVEESGAFLDGLAGIVGFHFSSNGSVLFSNAILRQQTSMDFIESQGRIRTWLGTNSDNQALSWMDRIRFWLRSKLFSVDSTLYSSFNPNVVVWRLLTSTGDAILGAATEADGTILQFDQDTLASLGPVSSFPSPPSKKEMIITTPAHYYEFDSYHVALEMKTEGYFPPVFSFSYVVYQQQQQQGLPFVRIRELEIATFSFLDREKQSMEHRPGYMHCFASTKRYLVLFLSRMRLNYVRLLNRDMSKGFFGLFDATDSPLEIIVLDKTQQCQEVGRFRDKRMCCHVWHMSNAFESTEDELVIDCSSTESMSLDKASFLLRIHVKLKSGGEMTCRKLCAEWDVEFPQVNPLVNGCAYRFVYALYKAATTEGGLVKINVETNHVEAKQYFEKGWLLAEPCFVPKLREYGSLTVEKEEDGVLLVAVTDTVHEKSFLAILNPHDLSEMARIEAPMVINAGLHSHFFPHSPLLCKI